MNEFLASLVAALAAGAVVAAKDTTTKALKDAYEGLRQYIARCYATVKLEDIDKNPDSKEQRRIVEEELKKAGADEDKELSRASKKLIDILTSEAPNAGKSVGVDLENIRAAIDIHIKRIGGEGPVVMKDIEAGRGSVIIEDVGHQRKN